MRVVVAVVFPPPVAVITNEYVPEVVPAIVTGGVAPPNNEQPLIKQTTTNSRATTDTLRLLQATKTRRREPAKMNKRTHSRAKISHLVDLEGIRNLGNPVGGDGRVMGTNCDVVLADVTTVSVEAPPAVTVPDENVQVERVGQPETLSVTCPERGGANVFMLNDTEPPAVTDIVSGTAVTPSGNGPAKFKTVLPPHSMPEGLLAVQSVES